MVRLGSGTLRQWYASSCTPVESAGWGFDIWFHVNVFHINGNGNEEVHSESF